MNHSTLTGIDAQAPIQRLSPVDMNMLDSMAQKDPVFAEVYRGYIRNQLNGNGAPEDQPILDPERFKVYTAVDALKPRPPIEWIVDGLFSVNSVGMIVGEGGSKKTYAMIDCAVCIATGANWLDFATKQAPVLIVDEENGEHRLGLRLGDTLRGHMADNDTPIFYVTLAQINLRDPGDVSALQLLIERTGAKFVVLDSMADFMPGADENSVKDVQPVFLALRKIANATRSFILLIHHSNKAGGYRGSTALKGAVDIMLMVESKKDSPFIEFDTEKSRDTEPKKFAAIAHFREGEFWLSAGDTKSKEPSYSKSERFVINFLTESGAAEMDKIMGAADVCSDEAARRAVYSLTDKGIVCRVNAGERGTKAVYDLRSNAQVVKSRGG